MKRKTPQQIMTADGMPKALMRTAEQRRAWWDKNPPRPYGAEIINLDDHRLALKYPASALNDPHARALIDALENNTREMRRERLEEFKASRPPRERKRPDKPSDTISVGQIATELKILPRVARQALRASKMTKPAFGWAFPPSDVPRIKKLIGDYLKCQTSVKPSKKRSTRSNTSVSATHSAQSKTKSPKRSHKSTSSSPRSTSTTKAKAITKRSTKRAASSQATKRRGIK